MEFTKIQGVGNDFIIINNMNLNLPVERFSYIAKQLCQRKKSIGADGLMVVDSPEGDADFKMRFYNSDGSIGEMCGNGARCIARYAYINNLAPKIMKFETLAGLVSAEILENRLVKIKLNKPELIELDYNIEIGERVYESSYIELGNPGLPHLVVKYPGLKEADDITDIAKRLRYYKELPKGANVNFYELIDENTAFVKTYERGVEDFTLACGTGVSSTAIILLLKKYVNSNNIKSIVPGGVLFVEIRESKNSIEDLYLIGDTNIIASGQILDEDLKT